ncbi:MAG: TIGR03862 family flavoprotein [Alphaproteobacteria bacterium]|nr:TIGR03862 family flavoprotein [Alphaproteobacteria bacterium]
MQQTPQQLPRAIVVGAGPAGLAAAEVLADAGVRVALHDRMPNPARKFLLAGRGGLNLTHSENLETFLERYGAARPWLEPAIRAFPPEEMRAWCEGLGVETFVGSSGRVFPRTMKASPLLRTWLARLASLSVEFHARSRWAGWNGPDLAFETDAGKTSASAEVAILALGGASWPRLGSDGSWQGTLAARGVALAPLRPANCGFRTGWSDIFRDQFAGHPVKSARFSFAGESVRGEAMITRNGIEGGPVYALSASLRNALESGEMVALEIDLYPDLTLEALMVRLTQDPAGPIGQMSMSNRLRKAGLAQAAAGLLREDVLGPALPDNPGLLAARIKRTRIQLQGAFPIERAISTAGGVRWDSLSADLSLKADPRTFVCGEMLDWEAPTGGYLLQACIATGRAAGLGALARVRAAAS